MKKTIVCGIFALIYWTSVANTLDNGLALTPPMGWLTWQRFRCNIDCENDPANCISERLFRDQADRMAEDGYLEAGYEYIIMDDCWLDKTRDPATNRLRPDPVRFPNGIKALVDYVHSKGIKFGIYEDYGVETCAGYPGSMDFLKLDATTFAEWEVDYVKFDGCYSNEILMDFGYPLMSAYLNQTNRPMVFDCEWPLYMVTIPPDYRKISKFCNLWRNYHDIDDSFDSFNSIIEYYADNQAKFSKFHGPGGWFDPDMLLIGNFGLSFGQSQAQMALWSIISAPLIMSVDLRTIEPWAKDILLNKNLIAINQDKLGIMGVKFYKENGVEVWHKPLDKNKTAFVFYNPLAYGTPTRLSIQIANLGLNKFSFYNLYEAFSGQLINKFAFADMFNVTVNPSGSVFVMWAEPAFNGNKPSKLYSSLK